MSWGKPTPRLILPLKPRQVFSLDLEDGEENRSFLCIGYEDDFTAGVRTYLYEEE